MFENWSALLGIDHYLTECVVESSIVPDISLMDDTMKKVSKTVYSVLCLHVTGRALATVRLSQRFNGLEAWRLLVKEYESSASPDRSAAILAGLLAPAWQSLPCTLELEQSIQRWEMKIKDYEMCFVGQTFPDTHKLATIRK